MAVVNGIDHEARLCCLRNMAQRATLTDKVILEWAVERIEASEKAAQAIHDAVVTVNALAKTLHPGTP